MSSKVHHFNITKYSIYKDNQAWFHYPQRSEISINFLTLEDISDEVNVTILWRGTTIDKFKLFITEKCYTSLLSKCPCLGVKQCDAYGRILKRFQISLENEQAFKECLKLLENEFLFRNGAPKGDSAHPLTTSGSQQLFSSQQLVASQRPVASQLQIIDYPSQLTEPQSIMHRGYTMYPNLVRNCQPVHTFPTSSIYASQQDLSYPLETSTAKPIRQPINMFPLEYTNLTEKIVLPPKDLDDLKKLTDNELRRLIRSTLEDKEFENFIHRLENIISGL